MTEIERAIDLVPEGETAIVLLTRGELFTRNADGTGTTGNWKFNPNNGRQISRVIVCYEYNDRRSIDVLIADYVGAVCPIETGRYETDGRWVIRMAGIHRVGTTRHNWKQFADAGTNPVRFLSNPPRPR